MSQQALPQTSHYSGDDVKIIDKSSGYDGFFKVNVYRLQHRLFAGSWNEPIVRELFERGHAAALLPYDPVRDQIVLVEQFRIGAIETSPTPWLLELVAGIIDEGETAEAVVRREAVEEAGIEVGRCEHAISYLVSRVAALSGSRSMWARWMPARPRGSTVWRRRARISGCTW